MATHKDIFSFMYKQNFHINDKLKMFKIPCDDVLQLNAIYENPHNLRMCIEPSERVRHEAIKRDPFTIKYIERPSSDEIVEALSSDMSIYRSVEVFITPEILLRTFHRTPFIIKYMPRAMIYDNIIESVIDRCNSLDEISILKDIDLSSNMLAKIFIKFPAFIYVMENQSLEIQKLLVYNAPGHLLPIGYNTGTIIWHPDTISIALRMNITNINYIDLNTISYDNNFFDSCIKGIEKLRINSIILNPVISSKLVKYINDNDIQMDKLLFTKVYKSLSYNDCQVSFNNLEYQLWHSEYI